MLTNRIFKIQKNCKHNFIELLIIPKNEYKSYRAFYYSKKSERYVYINLPFQKVKNKNVKNISTFQKF